MGFADAIRTCLGKYVTFSGRARRPEYWWFVLFVILGGLVLSVVDFALFGGGAPPGQAPQPITGIFQLAVLLPLLAAGWRRMHDTGRPGWLILLPLIVSVASGVLLVGGVLGVAAIEGGEGTGAEVEGELAAAGGIGVLLAYAVQLAVAVVMIWLLTRPSQPGTNAYGPEPEPG